MILEEAVTRKWVGMSRYEAGIHHIVPIGGGGLQDSRLGLP